MLGLYANSLPAKTLPATPVSSQSSYQKRRLTSSTPSGTMHGKITKAKKQETAIKLISSVFDIESPKVNEQNYKINFSSPAPVRTSPDETAFSIDKINKRSVCKLLKPLNDSFVKTENKIKSQAVNEKDPAFQLINKHKKNRKVLKLKNERFNADTLEVSLCESEDSFNNSFNEPLKKRLVRDGEFFTPFKSSSKVHNNAKKLKKPKILKSDGMTVTAESVMRMVDPSFLVSSDVDDSSLISANNSAIIGNSNPLRLSNLLDDLNKFDQIDSTLSINNHKPKTHSTTVPTSLSKEFTSSETAGDESSCKTESITFKMHKDKAFFSQKQSIW